MTNFVLSYATQIACIAIVAAIFITVAVIAYNTERKLRKHGKA